MAVFKQGQFNQVVFVMVDKTNFASVESGISSNFTCRLYTYKQNDSGPTSAVTLSRAPSVVRSGIIRVIMKPTETSGVDNALLYVSHASCAAQYIPINFQVQNISNYLSDASAISSNIYSMLSDLHSRVPKEVSTKSLLSDVYSKLSDMSSDIYARQASQFVVVSNYLSNASNYLSNISALVSDVDSALTSQYSNITSRVPKAVATNSQLSDLHSKIYVRQSSQFAVVSNYLSNASNYLSNISALVSDVDSQVNIIDSRVDDLGDPSAIADRVWSDFGSKVGRSISDVVSELVALSDVSSKIYARQASQFSDFQSRVPKAVATASRLLLLESVASDAHSAAAQANSRALVMQSTLSDIDSALTSQYSDLASKIGNVSVTLTASDISDIASATAAAIEPAAIGPSDISDIASAVWAKFESKVGSTVSDLYSDIVTGGGATASEIADKVWSDFGSKVGRSISDVMSELIALSDAESKIYARQASQFSDFQSRVPKAVATNSQLSDIYSKISDMSSDIYARQASQFSDLNSDISHVKSAIAALPNLSDAISDIYVRQQSQFAVISNYLSDASAINSNIYSLLSDTHSNLQSQVSHVKSAVAALPNLSDAVSDVYARQASQFAVISNYLSNISSAESNIYSAISDAHSDIYSLLSDVNAKTAGLTFTVAGQVDANIQYVNDVAVSGTGAVGDEWGP